MTQLELKTEAGPKRTTHRPPFPATCSSPRVFSLSSAEHSEGLCPPQWIASLLPRSLSSRSLAPSLPRSLVPCFPKCRAQKAITTLRSRTRLAFPSEDTYYPQ